MFLFELTCWTIIATFFGAFWIVPLYLAYSMYQVLSGE